MTFGTPRGLVAIPLLVIAASCAENSDKDVVAPAAPPGASPQPDRYGEAHKLPGRPGARDWIALLEPSSMLREGQESAEAVVVVNGVERWRGDVAAPVSSYNVAWATLNPANDVSIGGDLEIEVRCNERSFKATVRDYRGDYVYVICFGDRISAFTREEPMKHF